VDRTPKGWLQPEVEYVDISSYSRLLLIGTFRYMFDILVPPGADPALFQPKPHDNEVECFEVK
jgi:hypothetical protein